MHTCSSTPRTDTIQRRQHINPSQHYPPTQSKTIKPGEEAEFSSKGISIGQADTEESIAWKNGYFRFNDENIESIMRKLSRWYDIEVSFQGPMSSEGFNGKISRYKNISQALKMLEQTGAVHFEIKGRRISVTK